MTRLRLAALLGVLVGVMVLLSPLSAAAASGTGTGTIDTKVITSTNTFARFEFQTRDLTGTISGDFQGTFTEHIQGIITPRRLVLFGGTMTFTGTVGTCGTGTVVLQLTGVAIAGTPWSRVNAQVVDDPSNTVAVTGGGFINQNGADLTYQVQYTCD